MNGATTGESNRCIAVSVLLTCTSIGPVRAVEAANVTFDNSRNAAVRDMFDQGVTLPPLFAVNSVDKQPVTPGEVLPARELYADMLFESGKYQESLAQYQRVLGGSPSRLTALAGLGKLLAGTC